MKKSFFIVLFLTVGTWAYAQYDRLFVGFRFFQDMGFEVGMTKDKIGYKIIAAWDYSLMSYEDDLKKGDYSKHLGERYHLVYGLGFMYNVSDPLWLSVNAGYGWAGKYGWDRNREVAGSIGTVQGLDVGVELRYDLSDYYFSVGYETIPAGFAVSKPVNIVSLAVGISF